MANGIGTGDPRGFNKGRSSKLREGSRIRQTPEEGRWTYRPKRCGNNKKMKTIVRKTLNVSANMSSGLLQVFVELGNLHETSSYVLYWIHVGRLFWFR